MKKLVCLFGFVGVILSGTAGAGPTYSGSLSAPSGLAVGGDGAGWTVPPYPTISWVVTETTPGMWHYAYTFTVPANEIYRIIIEASDDCPGPAFELDNLQAATLAGPVTGIISVGNHSVVPENPGMPEDLWGIQVDITFPTTAVTLSFDSDRRPVWGDFYARTLGTECPADHSYATPNLMWAHNLGFTAGDTDPLDPPGNEPVLNHLLVPDSTPTIPAPGAIFLGAMGLAILSRLRRRRPL